MMAVVLSFFGGLVASAFEELRVEGCRLSRLNMLGLRVLRVRASGL